jgi:hypothetical protein
MPPLRMVAEESEREGKHVQFSSSHLQLVLAFSIAATFVLFSTTATAPTTSVPINTPLIHIYLPWEYPPPAIRKENPSCTAPATILLFSSSGDYVDHSCYVITGREGHSSLSISAGDGHTVAIGRWSQRDNRVTVIRQKVYRFVRFQGPGKDPLCTPAPITYDIVPSGVRAGKFTTSPTRKILNPEWPAYIGDAQRSDTSCSEGAG